MGSWVAHSNSFYLTLTSDSNPDLYTDNKTSSFRVQLNDRLELEPEQWQVGLVSIYYPYDINTLGKESFIKIRYGFEVFNLTMPDWHCETVETLIQFMSDLVNNALFTHYKIFQKRLHAEKHGSVDAFNEPKPIINFSLDSLKRLKISTRTSILDIAFSSRMLQTLGLLNSPQFSIEKFDLRTKILDGFRNEGDSLYHQTFIINSLLQHLLNLENEFSNTHGKHANSIESANLQLITELHTQFLQRLNMTAQSYLLKLRYADVRQSNFSDLNAPISADWPKNTSFEKFITPQELKECQRKYGSSIQISPSDSEDYSDQYYTSKVNHEVLFHCIIKKLFDELLTWQNFTSDMAGVSNPYDLLYVYTDIIKPEPFNNLMTRVLALFKTEGVSPLLTEYTAKVIQYKQLDRADITNLKIIILGSDGVPVPFLRGPLVLTLHFVRSNKTRSLTYF